MSHKKWRREQKAKDDNRQSRFTKTGTVQEPIKMTTIIGQVIPVTEQFSCPFCLGIYPLQKYLISTSKGYHRGLAKCPECGNQMRFESLTKQWTPEQYAEWCYPYSASGFWQKVPFTKWKDRLYKIGWSSRFWSRYRQLKGEDETPSYEQYLKDQQEEWAKEEGLIDEHG